MRGCYGTPETPPYRVILIVHFGARVLRQPWHARGQRSALEQAAMPPALLETGKLPISPRAIRLPFDLLIQQGATIPLPALTRQRTRPFSVIARSAEACHRRSTS
jgi:hypothetical protein